LRGALQGRSGPAEVQVGRRRVDQRLAGVRQPLAGGACQQLTIEGYGDPVTLKRAPEEVEAAAS